MSIPWTNTEKRELLIALQKYGPDNLEAIQQHLQFRTVTEIRQVLEKYKKRACIKWNALEKVQEEESPLNTWIQILNNSTKNGEIIDIIPRVLKYIALFEKKCDTPCHLSDCYMVLSEISNGKASKDVNAETTYFLNQCLTELAKMSQSEVESKKKFVKNLKPTDFENVSMKTYQSKKQLSKNVNPFAIPEKLLKKEPQKETT